HVGQFRFYDHADDKVSRHRPSAIEIKRRQNRFQRVHQQAGLVAAAAFFFAAAQAHVMTNLQLLRHPQQMPLPDQMRPQLRKMPFLEFGEAMEQRLASDEAEHGIPKELEDLVVATARAAARRPASRAQRFYLARLRTVGKRLIEQFPALELEI